jgi:hypothetical protein
MNRVAGFNRNGWPTSVGIGGRIASDHWPACIGLRSQTEDYPFGTIKAWMGTTHFLMRRRHKVATGIALKCARFRKTSATAAIDTARPKAIGTSASQMMQRFCQ